VGVDLICYELGSRSEKGARLPCWATNRL